MLLVANRKNLADALAQALGDLGRLTATKRFTLIILGAVAFISVGQGVLNGVKNSQDFEWSPTVLFIEGENPYQHYLNGNQDQRIILSQVPNYAHALYIILVPIAALGWEKAKIVWERYL